MALSIIFIPAEPTSPPRYGLTLDEAMDICDILPEDFMWAADEYGRVDTSLGIFIPATNEGEAQ